MHKENTSVMENGRRSLFELLIVPLTWIIEMHKYGKVKLCVLTFFC